MVESGVCARARMVLEALYAAVPLLDSPLRSV